LFAPACGSACLCKAAATIASSLNNSNAAPCTRLARQRVRTAWRGSRPSRCQRRISSACPHTRHAPTLSPNEAAQLLRLLRESAALHPAHDSAFVVRRRKQQTPANVPRPSTYGRRCRRLLPGVERASTARATLRDSAGQIWLLAPRVDIPRGREAPPPHMALCRWDRPHFAMQTMCSSSLTLRLLFVVQVRRAD
jgi:hypothetical protein